MPLKLKKLSNGLGATYNKKSKNAKKWSRLIAKTIWSYTSDTITPTTGARSGKSAFIATFIAESDNLDGYLPRALTSALPVLAAGIAAGMQPAFTATPPGPVPNFQAIMNSSRDAEATSDEAVAALATAIHNWFVTGISINNTSGVSVPWGTPTSALIGPNPTTEFSLTPEDLEGAQDALVESQAILDSQKEEVDSLYELANSPSAVDEYEIAEYTLLIAEDNVGKETEIVGDASVPSIDVDLSQDEIQAALENTDTTLSSDLGAKIVEFAKADIGIAETGYKGHKNDLGLNYGGYKHPTDPSLNSFMPESVSGNALSEAGRIDEMHSLGGIDNYKEILEGKKGKYWCASAVLAWWDAAGASTPKFFKGVEGKYENNPTNRVTVHPVSGNEIPANGMWRPAYCPSWRAWAKENNLWSDDPVIGAAIIFYSKASHIGIVASIASDGAITSIEGNTSKSGFNSNGVFCATKVVAAAKVNGYIHPRPKGTLPNTSGTSHEFDPCST